MRTMHLFAGAGGGLLADLILGHEPVIAVEWDTYACRVLRERAEEGWFPGLHVWKGDVRMFDPSEYAGRVDCIAAGFPCQDLSVAGKKSGLGEGTRSGLYREVIRIARIVRPRYLFLENVAAILSNGLGTVLADLAALGYDCRWTCLRASECGANHHRDRWWLLADSNGFGSRTLRANQTQTWPATAPQPTGKQPAYVADPECGRLQERRGVEYSQKIGEDEGRVFRNFSPSLQKQAGEVLADADIAGREKQHITPITSRTRYGSWCSVEEPRVGWWEAEPDVGRVADGVASRVDRLKCAGNGQVPLQAAAAWIALGGPMT